MLGTFWLAQHTLLGLCARIDRNASWLQLAFLFAVTLLPFSATLLAGYVEASLAILLYWLNVFLFGVALAASAAHISRASLLNESNTWKLRVFRQRIVVAQLAYALAALVGAFNAYASIAALGAVQLYFIVSPPVPVLDRVLHPTDDG